MFKIQRSPEIESRAEFASLCNRYELFEAAEIGTDRGTFAAQFLSEWKGHTLLLVDDYQAYENMPWPRDLDRLVAAMRMVPFGDHARFIPIRSPEAASRIPGDWRLQFIYIDGAHDFASVAADLEARWLRLDNPGILAGHDWVTKPENDVVRAVTAFAKRHELTVLTTYEGGTPPSWYIKKGV